MSCRILVVEDNPITRKMLVVALGTAHHEVAGAGDGRSALERIARDPPDLVVLDLVLPDMDGISLAREIRKVPRGNEILLVALSGLATKLEEALGAGVGFEQVLYKPIEPSRLIATVETLLAGPAQRLQQQVILNEQLAKEAAAKTAQLAILSSVAGVVAQNLDVDVILRDVLAHTLDATGVSMGAIYFAYPGGHFGLASQLGYPNAVVNSLKDFFGHPELLACAFAGDKAVSLQTPSRGVPAVGSTPAESDMTFSTLVPLVAGGERLGVLALASAQRDLGSEWDRIAPALGVQIAQAVALARRMTDLRDSEQRYRRLVDELRATEDQRQKHLQLLRAVIDGTTDAIYVKDLEGRYLLMNTGAAAMIGRVPEQVIGQTDVDIFGVEASRASRAEDRLTIAAGETRTLEETIPFGEGKVVTFLSTKGVFRDQDGNVAGVFGISKDLTRYRELESRLQQAQKMEAIGRLAGGIAHDFNNMLSAIMSYADLLREDLPEGDSRREDVQEISRAAVRAAGLTRQLLAFSRQQVMEIRVLNLNDVVAAVDKMLRRIIGEDVNLDTKLVADLGSIKADPGQLEQVIMNLAVNARDAMPSGGQLTIETANIEIGKEYAAANAIVAPGRYVMLAVADTGVGMDEATRERVFEPFFTTKEKGKGTGLGLSVVYGIVQQCGGYIWLYSEPQHGSIFKIFFPRVDAVPDETSIAAQATTPATGRETILLVEDEDALRKVGRAILARQGYNVLLAASGEEAIALCERRQDAIDLIATDLVMPGLSGTDVVTRCLARFPNAKVLFMSGYTDDALTRAGISESGRAFLQKPFSAAALTQKVRDVLDGTLRT